MKMRGGNEQSLVVEIQGKTWLRLPVRNARREMGWGGGGVMEAQVVD